MLKRLIRNKETKPIILYFCQTKVNKSIPTLNYTFLLLIPTKID